MANVTFRALVEQKFIFQGVLASTAVARVHVESGVALGSVWRAYRGTRVAPETAARLREWAWLEHGTELDLEALVTAPTRSARKLQGATRDAV